MTQNRYEARLLARFCAIPGRTWAAVCAALLVGVLAHLAALTGLIVNGDSMVPVVSGKWLLSQGKWANGFFADMRGTVNLTIVTGPISLLWLALSAGLTVSSLDIKSPALCALCGAMMATFPSVVCTFLYNAPDIFFFSLLLSVCAVYVTRKYRFGFVSGALLLAVSIGVYQAYVGMAAGLLLLAVLCDLLAGKKPVRRTLLDGCKYIGVLLAGVLLYYLALQAVLAAKGGALQAYRGIDHMGEFTVSSLAGAAAAAYRKVLLFFAYDQYGVIGGGMGAALYLSTLAACAALFAVQTVRTRLYARPGALLLTLLLTGLMPLAIHAVAVLGQNAETHWLMIYAVVLVFVAMLKLADLCAQPIDQEAARAPAAGAKGEAARFACKAAPALLSVALVCSWYLITTQNYARMRLSYEGAFGTASVIAAGVLAQPSFSGETPVAMIGGITEERADFRYLDNFTGSFDKDYLFNSWVVQNMITRYVQVEMQFVSVEEKERLLETQAFADMPVYPDNGYIGEIDGMIVVKLAENEPIIFG